MAKASSKKSGRGKTTANTGSCLKLQIIGKFSATVNEQVVALGRKGNALIGYMILSVIRQAPRSKFIGLLWSNKDETLAKGSLRQLLSDMKHDLEKAGCRQFHITTTNVTLDIENVVCDAIEILAQAESGLVNPLLLACERLSDSLLEDVANVDPAFSDWVTDAQTTYCEQLTQALVKLLPEEGEFKITDTAEAAAKALYRLNNENEQAVRVMIKAHAAAGNIGAAISLYARLWRHLEDTYDIEPHKLTQDLIARLRQEQPESPASPAVARAASTSGSPNRPSIAVLPFQSLTANLEPTFSIGIVDSVVQALSTMKELFVISRASTMMELSPTPDLRAIGRDLQADYVLHGAIQRSQDQIRISSELVVADTVEVVRSDRLSGTVADVFDLQDRLAVEVIRSLAPDVRDRELNRAMQKRPDDLNAYQLTLIGYNQMFKAEYTTFATARTNFERAHVLSPTWAPPLSYSAIWHMQRAARGWSVDILKELEAARALAERALERNSSDAIANAVSAYTLSHCRHDHAGALKQLNRAIELTPNLAHAFAFRAAVQVRCENYHEALQDVAIHMRLSPNDELAVLANMAMSQAHFALGDLAAAIEPAKRVAVLLPINQANLRILVAALVESGRLDEAKAYAPGLMKAGVLDLSWVAVSPWPKALLKRIAAAHSQLASLILH